jgi:hypothetical protein
MTAILNIITSFILIFLIFSIVISGLQEWWAQFFGHRGQFLRMGMQRLISDEAIFVRVIQHPLVGNLYRDRAARGKPPSYVEPANFALAFADIVLRRAGGASDASTDAIQAGPPALTYDNLHDAVAKLRLQHSSAALAVLPIIESSKDDLNVALKGIEEWFTNGMDRVTGWYKAYAQRRLFVWGLVVACLCNVDAIEIYYALNRSPALSADLSAIANSVANSGAIAGVDLKGRGDKAFTPDEAKTVMDAVLAKSPPALPIGYACLSAVAKVDAVKPDTNKPVANDTDAIKDTLVRCHTELRSRIHHASVLGLVLQVIGWSLTALAGVLGAPYWFGMLSKVVNIRGSGPKPQTSPPQEKKNVD